ncbi:formylglycine-generating enzyme family protein [Stutzerimonas stutzeri]|uniref:formylglycine-generating enzyme family protein n=1 Tax=Stutzerimonas stutzeri TaxID=316 RepID=UPI001C2E7AE9|nr:SUMF1/EgtB/PvdO family nonheme iron enzyme [Stutzerimonas stutzeri]
MLTIRTLALLIGYAAATVCSATNLPESQKLSPDKVGEIASRIDAQYPALPQGMRDDILGLVVKSLDEMIFIKGGEFEMGDFGWKCDFDPAEVCIWPCGVPEDNVCNITMMGDSALHHVELSSYHLAAKKTTLGSFDLYRSAQGLPLVRADQRNRERLKHRFDPLNPAPIRQWQEAKDYCQWIGKLSGYPVDLPTEAQWEYAARSGGQKVLYPTDDGSLKPGVNYAKQSGRILPERVDTYPPNPIGLYSMTGIATEVVNDWYSKDYFESSPIRDPQGPEAGTTKVARGTNSIETPWLSANTVIRRSRPLDVDEHLFTESFRCAVKTSEPL